MDSLYWKHLFIRTPVEGVAKKLQHGLAFWRVVLHPGIREVYFEGGRLDRAMARLVTPASNCIDVGAHLGSTLSPRVTPGHSTAITGAQHTARDRDGTLYQPC